ncbi:protein MIZU-KUSSEI 1-like [Melia azedarach]|uniref:Protein MIZU-KUSSEI 1-like n=1 Tax=Melia azedarach TaxID=155640 RepID=A0ACC1XUW3_MELAZ|nr:protein MIZU-KUSSEI 1-like [Melia azedarach]
MTMTYSTIGGTTLATGVTAVECQKQVRSWRLLRYLMEFLIPSCNCTAFIDEKDFMKEENYIPSVCYRQPSFSSSSSSSNTITGTIFGYRRGKVRFCIQANAKSTDPILLLDLAVPTAILAREMQGGLLRIALESTTVGDGGNTQSLMSTPVWTMYCNGRRVGYAVKSKISKADMDLLRMMDSVVAGAGVISGKELDHDDELMYLRASFKRVCGSSDSESYHLIDPDGNIGQELSIFFFRSR